MTDPRIAQVHAVAARIPTHHDDVQARGRDGNPCGPYGRHAVSWSPRCAYALAAAIVAGECHLVTGDGRWTGSPTWGAAVRRGVAEDGAHPEDRDQVGPVLDELKKRGE